MTEPTSNDGFAGQQGLTDDTSQFNVTSFIVQQALGRISTMKLVEVMAVTNDGGISEVGFVDARPLVNQMDGLGKATPHQTIFNLPYFRIQGGSNALILDPKVGDIGLAVIADRDSSAVKATKAVANPGSKRRFDLADGVYVGGILNGTPTSYVAFDSDGGITLSPDSGATYLKVTAGKIEMVANEIISHAHNKNAFDAGGTGFVYQVAQIDSYTDGVASSHHTPTPPEVPT